MKKLIATGFALVFAGLMIVPKANASTGVYDPSNPWVGVNPASYPNPKCVIYLVNHHGQGKCDPMKQVGATPREHLNANQRKAGCSLVGGLVMCPSPGTGMAWKKGHNPWLGELAEAYEVDVPAQPVQTYIPVPVPTYAPVVVPVPNRPITSGFNTTNLGDTGSNYYTTPNTSSGFVAHLYNGDTYTVTPYLNGQSHIQDANGRDCTAAPPNLNGTVVLNCN